MQIKQSQRVVGFDFPTINDLDKILNIKLGTSVHLRTWELWLITLCWVTGHHRSRFLWTCWSLSPFLWPGPSSNLRRVSVPRRFLSLPLFGHCWGSEFFRIRRSRTTGRYQSVCGVCQEWAHRKCLLTPMLLWHSDLAGEGLGEVHQIGGLITD